VETIFCFNYVFDNLFVSIFWAPLKTRLPRFARNDKSLSLRGFEKAVAVYY